MAGKKGRRKKTAKPKPKAKAEAKAKPKRYGERVAIYFGKQQADLLTWAREHAAKKGVGLNRLVQDGLRAVHELETDDVHHQSDKESAVGQTPAVDQ